eukprot:Nk52_evm4s2377 gene=Nk52_evmTU4s2377
MNTNVLSINTGLLNTGNQRRQLQLINENIKVAATQPRQHATMMREDESSNSGATGAGNEENTQGPSRHSIAPSHLPSFVSATATSSLPEQHASGTSDGKDHTLSPLLAMTSGNSTNSTMSPMGSDCGSGVTATAVQSRGPQRLRLPQRRVGGGGGSAATKLFSRHGSWDSMSCSAEPTRSRSLSFSSATLGRKGRGSDDFGSSVAGSSGIGSIGGVKEDGISESHPADKFSNLMVPEFSSSVSLPVDGFMEKDSTSSVFEATNGLGFVNLMDGVYSYIDALEPEYSGVLEDVHSVDRIEQVYSNPRAFDGDRNPKETVTIKKSQEGVNSALNGGQKLSSAEDSLKDGIYFDTMIEDIMLQGTDRCGSDGCDRMDVDAKANVQCNGVGLDSRSLLHVSSSEDQSRGGKHSDLEGHMDEESSLSTAECKSASVNVMNPTRSTDDKFDQARASSIGKGTKATKSAFTRTLSQPSSGTLTKSAGNRQTSPNGNGQTQAKKTCWVWQYVSMEKNEDGTLFKKCLFCPDSKFSGKTSSSTMGKHVKDFHFQLLGPEVQAMLGARRESSQSGSGRRRSSRKSSIGVGSSKVAACDESSRDETKSLLSLDDLSCSTQVELPALSGSEMQSSTQVNSSKTRRQEKSEKESQRAFKRPVRTVSSSGGNKGAQKRRRATIHVVPQTTESGKRVGCTEANSLAVPPSKLIAGHVIDWILSEGIPLVTTGTENFRKMIDILVANTTLSTSEGGMLQVERVDIPAPIALTSELEQIYAEGKEAIRVIIEHQVECLKKANLPAKQFIGIEASSWTYKNQPFICVFMSMVPSALCAAECEDDDLSMKTYLLDIRAVENLRSVQCDDTLVSIVNREFSIRPEYIFSLITDGTFPVLRFKSFMESNEDESVSSSRPNIHICSRGFTHNSVLNEFCSVIGASLEKIRRVSNHMSQNTFVVSNVGRSLGKFYRARLGTRRGNGSKNQSTSKIGDSVVKPSTSVSPSGCEMNGVDDVAAAYSHQSKGRSCAEDQSMQACETGSSSTPCTDESFGVAATHEGKDSRVGEGQDTFQDSDIQNYLYEPLDSTQSFLFRLNWFSSYHLAATATAPYSRQLIAQYLIQLADDTTTSHRKRGVLGGALPPDYISAQEWKDVEVATILLKKFAETSDALFNSPEVTPSMAVSCILLEGLSVTVASLVSEYVGTCDAPNTSHPGSTLSPAMLSALLNLRRSLAGFETVESLTAIEIVACVMDPFYKKKFIQNAKMKSKCLQSVCELVLNETMDDLEVPVEASIDKSSGIKDFKSDVILTVSQYLNACPVPRPGNCSPVTSVIEIYKFWRTQLDCARSSGSTSLFSPEGQALKATPGFEALCLLGLRVCTINSVSFCGEVMIHYSRWFMEHLDNESADREERRKNQDHSYLLQMLAMRNKESNCSGQNSGKRELSTPSPTMDMGDLEQPAPGQHPPASTHLLQSSGIAKPKRLSRFSKGDHRLGCIMCTTYNWACTGVFGVGMGMEKEQSKDVKFAPCLDPDPKVVADAMGEELNSPSSNIQSDSNEPAKSIKVKEEKHDNLCTDTGATVGSLSSKQCSTDSSYPDCSSSEVCKDQTNSSCSESMSTPIVEETPAGSCVSKGTQTDCSDSRTGNEKPLASYSLFGKRKAYYEMLRGAKGSNFIPISLLGTVYKDLHSFEVNEEAREKIIFAKAHCKLYQDQHFLKAKGPSNINQ